MRFTQIVKKFYIRMCFFITNYKKKTFKSARRLSGRKSFFLLLILPTNVCYGDEISGSDGMRRRLSRAPHAAVDKVGVILCVDILV